VKWDEMTILEINLTYPDLGSWTVSEKSTIKSWGRVIYVLAYANVFRPKTAKNKLSVK